MTFKISIATLTLGAALLVGCGNLVPPPDGEAVLGVSAEREDGAEADLASLPTDAPNPAAGAVAPPPVGLPVSGQQIDPADLPPPPEDDAPPDQGAPPATIGQLCAQVRQLAQERGRERSLLATLNCDEEDGPANVRAFINQVEARRGRDLSVEDADRLIEIARALESQTQPRDRD